jgi:hypothetical protein
VDDVRPAAAQALADVFGFAFDEVSPEAAGSGVFLEAATARNA